LKLVSGLGRGAKFRSYGGERVTLLRCPQNRQRLCMMLSSAPPHVRGSASEQSLPTLFRDDAQHVLVVPVTHFVIADVCRSCEYQKLESDRLRFASYRRRLHASSPCS
jgi:hypothetical protein